MPYAHRTDEHTLETFVEECVDDEVDGRVKYDEHVGNVAQVELKAIAASPLERKHSPQHTADERRYLADD